MRDKDSEMESSTMEDESELSRYYKKEKRAKELEKQLEMVDQKRKQIEEELKEISVENQKIVKSLHKNDENQLEKQLGTDVIMRIKKNKARNANNGQKNNMKSKKQLQNMKRKEKAFNQQKLLDLKKRNLNYANRKKNTEIKSLEKQIEMLSKGIDRGDFNESFDSHTETSESFFSNKNVQDSPRLEDVLKSDEDSIDQMLSTLDSKRKSDAGATGVSGAGDGSYRSQKQIVYKTPPKESIENESHRHSHQHSSSSKSNPKKNLSSSSSKGSSAKNSHNNKNSSSKKKDKLNLDSNNNPNSMIPIQVTISDSNKQNSKNSKNLASKKNNLKNSSSKQKPSIDSRQFILIDPSIAGQIDEKKDPRRFRPFSYDNLRSSSEDESTVSNKKKKREIKPISIRESDEEDYSTEKVIEEYKKVHKNDLNKSKSTQKKSSLFKPKTKKITPKKKISKNSK